MSELMQTQQRVLTQLQKEMEKKGLSILKRDELNDEDCLHIDKVFLASVFPVLSPLAIDPAVVYLHSRFQEAHLNEAEIGVPRHIARLHASVPPLLSHFH